MARSDDFDVPGDQGENDLIPLKPKIVQKFYEPVVILSALVGSVKEKLPPVRTAPSRHDRTDKELFHSFVYNLAHVCANEPGGKTITAFMVLRDCDEEGEETAHFVFASNGRTDEELAETAAFAKELLRVAANAAPNKPADQLARIRRELSSYVLRFNRRRVNMYLRRLYAKVEECQAVCRTEDTEESKQIKAGLESLIGTDGAIPTHCSEAEYLHACETTVRALLSLSGTPAEHLIHQRASAANDSIYGGRTTECWHDLVHVINRIRAYQQSVNFIMQARKNWPQLFMDPVMSFISSSTPWKTPGRNKSMSAGSIIGRMTSDPEVQSLFRVFVQDMQCFDLDERIADEYGRRFKPIVHAEVLLLNWLELTSTMPGGGGNNRIDKSRFFNDWAYIGSSKPTCKLCAYYFQEHKSNVEHRPTHGNLYLAWRVPDVSRSLIMRTQGPNPANVNKAVAARQQMVNRVLERVRDEAFSVIRQKSRSTYKKNDSNTFSKALTLDQRGWSLLNGSVRGADSSRHSQVNGCGASTTSSSNAPRQLYGLNGKAASANHEHSVLSGQAAPMNGRYYYGVSHARDYAVAPHAVDDLASVMGQMGIEEETVGRADGFEDGGSSPVVGHREVDYDDDDDVGGAIL